MRSDDAVVLDVDGLDRLIVVLGARGYDTQGPVVRDGAIVTGPVAGVDDLPAGWRDEQAPGHYRLHREDDGQLFSWAVGPGSHKRSYFPPAEEQWRATRSGDGVVVSVPGVVERPSALIGARPCEAAALLVLDRVLRGGAHPDPRYSSRRRGTFLVIAECATPSGTCFCTSMGTGPSADVAPFDLALTELDDDSGHRFLVRAGSDEGAAVLRELPGRPPTDTDLAARDRLLDGAAERMGRAMPSEGLHDLFERNIEHPRWASVAERCLSCGNCTLVCPTCFCSDMRDTTDVSGTVHRERRWASCFDAEHSYMHGGTVRASTESRYRQWLTHKLGTWWDQFDTSGCVGCGRCITWCPVGIDITEEVAAIAASDGATAGPGRSGRAS